MSRTTKLWVIRFDGHKKPYYTKAAFCGGTYDIEDAHRYAQPPKLHAGKAVEVVVTTKVEIKAH